ncbi:MAG: (2Fe-2S) ferredoxin domain-containing protein [Candidatus Omnitrophota bacterium]
MSKLSKEDLDRKVARAPQEEKNWIKVGMSSCGIAAGAEEVFNILREEVKKRNLQVSVKKCGCAGMCYAEPLVEVSIEGMLPVVYGKVNKEVAMLILEEHIHNRRLINDHIYDIIVKRQQS